MKKPLRIGCLVLLLYCIACSLLSAISGQGMFLSIAALGTLQGGNIPERERMILRGVDIVTAPLQVAIVLPMAAIQYIRDHTGERGRELAERKRQEAACEQYMKCLDEDFDRIYAEPGFLNPTNKPAMKALDVWTRYHFKEDVWTRYHFKEEDAERKRRFAEYCLGHPELMPPLREFWRMCNVPEDLQRRALTVALDMAEKNPDEDVKWLLWGLMNVTTTYNFSPSQPPPYTFSDETLQGYLTNSVEIIRWSAQEALANRASYRDYLRRQNEGR